MLNCPHCGIEIKLREVPHQGLFKSQRTCPGCNGNFIPDADTRRRQYVFMVLMLVSLILTLLLYYAGTQWLLPAVLSYAAVGYSIYRGSIKMTLVPYERDSDAR